ncbi:MAG: 4'-phosphopantetheinyl transferase superfamily protein [Gammaproteobacteria bacterium]
MPEPPNHLLPSSWSEPPARWSALPGEIQVWHFSLAVDRAEESLLYQLLSERERGKADRLVRAEHRRREIVAHATLRRILASYLDADAGRLVFQREVRGKPYLEPAPGARQLQFNLSHSQDHALVAVCLGRRVGVDVEMVRQEVPAARLARRFFEPGEADALETLPPAEQLPAFFRAWTRKEALLKATGEGIVSGGGLHRIAVDFSDVPTPDWSALHLGANDRWKLANLPAIDGAAATVAGEGDDWSLRCWRWRGT